MSEKTISEELLQHDSLIVAAGLALLTVVCWAWIIAGAGMGMSATAMSTWQFPPPAGMDSMMMSGSWEASYFLLMLAMWWVMMIAMMVPSATPMVLLYARVCRHAQERGTMERTPIPTAAFTAGYALSWLAFSAVAVLVQWSLEKLGLFHAMMMWSTSTAMSGTFLILAGLYQLSPLKHACLEHCRSPVDFLSKNWRKGRGGALVMGLHHGLYCVGCCWFLMALLFAGGVMNLVWIAGLAILVLFEKLIPHGQTFARIIGGCLVLAGLVTLGL